ncbi:MAG: VTT domain-containing protein [archaeon]|jgi:membrane protein YqaA with SNARE-associated domain
MSGFSFGFSQLVQLLSSLMMFFAQIGPVGLFIAAIIGNASLILPMPTDLVFILVIGSGIDYFGLGIFTVGLLGIIYGSGAAIGEMSSYFVGRAGIQSFESMKKSEVGRLKELKESIAGRGIPVIAFLAFIPLPFDVIGISAGLLKYPFKNFFLGCLIGKAARYFVFAYIVFFGAQWVGGVLSGLLPFALPLICVVVFLAVVFLLVRKFYFKKK